MARYDVGLACMNGHGGNSMVSSLPEFNAKFCQECGQPTIDHCSECSAAIRAHCHIEGMLNFAEWEVPSHCYECGRAYPGTQRRSDALAEAIDELDELDTEERERLKRSIPDILAEAPKSETAALRFKKAVGKVGSAGGKVLTNVLSKLATDAVKVSLGV